jgi:large subunit ribosomal protein MRP49
MDPATAPSTLRLQRRVETIDMKHKQESEILSRLLEVASGEPYEITPEELTELRELEDDKRSSQRDREAQARLNEVKRQEKALLDQARGITDAV